MSLGASLFLVAVGAILRFAITADLAGIDIQVVGTILMIVGIMIMAWPEIGLVTLAVFFALTMIFRGVFAIVAGLKLRGLSKIEEAPTEHTAFAA